jgi:hypothetical protein
MVPVMRDFYAGLAGGLPVAPALQRAKVASWRRGEPPRVWAALVVYGDGTGRVPLAAPHPSRRLWWLAALAAALLGAVGVARARRAQRATLNG